WNSLGQAGRQERLQEALQGGERAEKLAADEISENTPRDDIDAAWRAQIVHILSERLGLRPDQVRPVVQPPDYDDLDHGILGLIVRAHTSPQPWWRPSLARVVSALARWNPWTYNLSTEERRFSPYLVGLLMAAAVLATLGAALSLLMRETAARAVV